MGENWVITHRGPFPQMCPGFVGLGRWPFRLAVNGQAQAKDEALKRPSPPGQPVFRLQDNRLQLSYNRERALPAPFATSARLFTAWPTGLPTILGHTRRRVSTHRDQIKSRADPNLCPGGLQSGLGKKTRPQNQQGVPWGVRAKIPIRIKLSASARR